MTRTLTSQNGTPISRLAFGCMQFGGTADFGAAQEMFAASRAEGINHFDTAVGYNDGRADDILGKLITEDRESLIIATKVGYHGGAGRKNILTQFDQTRSRLALDFVDVLYLHRFDPDTSLAETIDTFVELQESGVIRYIGLSNFAAWQVMKAQMAASVLGTRIDIFQPMYSLVKRQAEVEILPMCADQSIAVASYSPLGGGLLTGKYANGESQGRLITDERYAERYAVNWMHGTAEDMVELAHDFGTEPATLAVAWAMHHPTQPMPIISARNVDQLRPSLDALTFKMTPEIRGRVSMISVHPTPATDRFEEL